MMTSFKREFLSLFRSFRAWAILATEIFVAGLTFATVNLAGSTSSLSYLSRNLLLLGSICIPILVFPSVKKERQGGLLRIWASSSVGILPLLVGKFLALCLWASFPLLGGFLFPLILSGYGVTSLLSLYLSLFGTLLGFVALSALSLWLSALFPKKWSLPLQILLFFLSGWMQTVADVLSRSPWIFFSLLSVLSVAGATVFGLKTKRLKEALLSGIIPVAVFTTLAFTLPRFFDVLLPTLLVRVSIPLSAVEFQNGVFPLRSTVYLVSLPILCLFFCTRMCKNAFSGRTNLADLRRLILGKPLVGALAGALLLCNILTAVLPDRASHYTVSREESFTVTSATKEQLSLLSSPVELSLLCEGGERNADPDLYDLLLQYASASPMIHANVRNISTYKKDSIEDQSILIRMGENERLISNSELYYYFNTSLMTALSPYQYQRYLQLCQEDGSTEALRMLSELQSTSVPYFCGQSVLTGRILSLAKPSVTVYHYISNTCVENDCTLRLRLLSYGMDYRSITSLARIPDDCDTLLLELKTDLTPTEAEALSVYLANGGGLVLASTPTNTSRPNLDSVLSAYGLSQGDLGVLYETSSDLILTSSAPSYLFTFKEIGKSEVTEHRRPIQMALTIGSHAISLTPTNGVTLTTVLETSAGAFPSSATSEEQMHIYPVAATAEAGNTRIFYIGTFPDYVSDSVSLGNNYALFANAIDWTANAPSDSFIPVSDAVLNGTKLGEDTSQKTLSAVAVTILLSLACLGVGGVIRYSRKKK